MSQLFPYNRKKRKIPKKAKIMTLYKIGITNYNSIQVALVKVHKRLTIGPNYTPHIVHEYIGNIYFILLLRLMVFLLSSLLNLYFYEVRDATI